MSYNLILTSWFVITILVNEKLLIISNVFYNKINIRLGVKVSTVSSSEIV